MFISPFSRRIGLEFANRSADTPAPRFVTTASLEGRGMAERKKTPKSCGTSAGHALPKVTRGGPGDNHRCANKRSSMSTMGIAQAGDRFDEVGSGPEKGCPRLGVGRSLGFPAPIWNRFQYPRRDPRDRVGNCEIGNSGPDPSHGTAGRSWATILIDTSY